MNPKDQGPDDYLRILVVISNPLGSLEGNVLTIPKYSLDVTYEWQLLADSIGKNRDELTKKYPPIALVRANPPTKEEIQIKLSPQFKYQILHFIGHGNALGIEIENEIGVSCALKTQDLISMVKGSALEFVFLNSCDSSNIGRELINTTQIQATIAAEDLVNDQIASFFAGKFYAQLANQKSVESAFSLAKAATKEKFSAYPPYSLFGNKEWKPDFYKEVEKPLFLYMDPPNNLPLGHLGKHTCRSGEMISLVQEGEKSRKVFNITGISGIGKTTFGLKYAQRYSSKYKDGIVYFDMGDVKSEKEILLTFGYVIDKIDQREIIKKITEGSYLILIDNLEEAGPELHRFILDFLAIVNWQITRSSLIFLTKRLYNKDELLHAEALVLEALEKNDIVAWLDKERPDILHELKDQSMNS